VLSCCLRRCRLLALRELGAETDIDPSPSELRPGFVNKLSLTALELEASA
jgi:hypothetical protein